MSRGDSDPWKSNVYGITLRENNLQLLVINTGEKQVLPHFDLEGELPGSGAVAASAGFQRLLGEKLIVLYRASYTENRAMRSSDSFFVLESLNSANHKGTWMDIDRIQTLRFTEERHFGIVEAIIGQVQNGETEKRNPPWARAGWYVAASKWIEEKLERAGLKLIRPPMTIKNWALSYVMRVETEKGFYYFKSCAELPLFVNEAQVVRALDSYFPGRVPVSFACDTERNWMLMEDVGKPIGWDAPLEERSALIRQFSQLQQESVGLVDQLLQNGCLDRRLEWLSGRVDSLVGSPLSSSVLQPDEMGQLESFVPSIKSMCLELEGHNIPQSLVHGDLHGGNVAGDKERLKYFDWTDACVSHPFFDMVDIFVEEDQEVREKLSRICREQWIDYEPPDRLLSAWNISQTLAALNQAISYHDIIENIDPESRHELDWGLPYWLRKVISSLK